MRWAKGYVLPFLLGALLMLLGWWLSIFQVGDDASSGTTVYGPWAWVGLGMVALGAYLPWFWVFGHRRSVRREKARRDAAVQAALANSEAEGDNGTAPDV